MLKATFVVALLFTVIHSSPLLAQICPTSTRSTNLICVIPQLYSDTGGVSLPNAAHAAHFDNSFQASAAALNSSVGTELSSLRLASPTSGITFVFENGVMRRTTESYGPILGERAETIGRHRIFLAATYQYFPFSTLDGIDLKHFPALFNHADTLNPNGTHRGPNDPPSPGNPGVELEYITTTNRVDLKVHQFTFYATYGLTNRIDVSVAIPILDVRLGMSSQATIVRNLDPIQQGPALKAAWQANPNTFPGDLYPSTGPLDPCVPNCSGYFHYFDANNPATSLNAGFSNAQSSSGMGDVVFRAKGTLLKRERTSIALGADVRVPSGDEKNFLGTGAAGVKPFLSASYHSRISPHANLGYEFNGNSILAGSPVKKPDAGGEGHLPDQLFYSAGVDAGITKKLTLAADLLGQRFYQAPGVKLGAWVDAAKTSHPDVLNAIPIYHSFNTDDLALGGKYSPAGNWLVTGNIQIKLDNGGLRAKVVPLIGLSYTF